MTGMVQQDWAHLPLGTRIYAIGDVHGRLDLLVRLVDLICADMAARPMESARIVLLGDMIDRGPDSKGVIDFLLAGPPDGLEFVCLRGNHEEVMLTFLADHEAGPGWTAWGGLETARSYVGDAELRGLENDMAALQMKLLRAVPPAHRRFLARLPLSHEAGDYYFVHAGIRPGTALDAQEPRDQLWIREDFLNDRRRHEKMVVHGHSITKEPDVADNRIGIDTGAYRSGRLTALVLEGDERRFIQTQSF